MHFLKPSAAELLNAVLQDHAVMLKDHVDEMAFKELLDEACVQKLKAALEYVHRAKRARSGRGTPAPPADVFAPDDSNPCATVVAFEVLRPLRDAVVASLTVMSRPDFLKLVRQAYPAGKGKGARLPYDPRKIRRAHHALIGDEDMTCVEACDALSKRLGLSRRSVERYLSRARRRRA